MPEDVAMPGVAPHHYSGFPSIEEFRYKSIPAVAAEPGKVDVKGLRLLPRELLGMEYLFWSLLNLWLI